MTQEQFEKAKYILREMDDIKDAIGTLNMLRRAPQIILVADLCKKLCIPEDARDKIEKWLDVILRQKLTALEKEFDAL